MSEIVTAVYKDRLSADRGVQTLTAAGFPLQDVSLLVSDAVAGREFRIEEGTKAAQGAGVGAIAGGGLGALAAGLIAVGAIAIPGLGLLAAGPIVATLAGAGAGGAAGTLVGSLVGAGIPEHQASIAEKGIKDGGILVAVRAHEDQVDLAREILKSTNAEKVRN